MAVFLVILAVALFCVGIAYINENVHDGDATVGYTICLVCVVLSLLGMACYKLAN